MAGACKACDPICGPIEGAFGKCAVSLAEEGRPAVLLLGGFLGGLQLADFVYDENGSYDFSTELVLDFSTALFFTLGSLSVYRKDKDLTVPVLVSSPRALERVLVAHRCARINRSPSMHACRSAPQRFGVLLLVLRLLNGLMMVEGVEVYCEQQLATCAGKEECRGMPCPDNTCSAYPCTWDKNGGQCIGALTQEQCVSSGDAYNAEHAVVPQLAAQLVYCWLLSAFAVNKAAAGALLAADDGTLQPP
jgi:hypothetical protein